MPPKPKSSTQAPAKPVRAAAAGATKKPASKTSTAAATGASKKTSSGTTSAKKPVAKKGTVGSGKSKIGAPGSNKLKKKEPKQLTPEEIAAKEAADRKAEEERKAREEIVRKERAAAREKYIQLIEEEEARILQEEAEEKRRQQEYNKAKTLVLESAFDDEVEDLLKGFGLKQSDLQIDNEDRFYTLCPFYVPNAEVEIDVEDHNQRTPLSEAACAGATTTLEILLRLGASLEGTDEYGRTPLYRAAFMGKLEAVKMLLEWGADPSVGNRDGELPVIGASDKNVKAFLSDWDMEETKCIQTDIGRLRERFYKIPVAAPPPPEDPKTMYTKQCTLRKMQDFLDAALKTRRPVLLVDIGGQANTYLRYRDTNFLSYFRPDDIKPDTVRRALIGSARFGKPTVLELGELLDWDLCSKVFESVRDGLWGNLLDNSFLESRVFMALVNDEDGHEYLPSEFKDETMAHFQLVLLTTIPDPPDEWTDGFYVLRVA